MRRWAWIPAGAAAAMALAVPAWAQQSPSKTSSAPKPPAVGERAPDFVLPGATRFGVLKSPVRLSDFRGETVVLAFFIKARTKG